MTNDEHETTTPNFAMYIWVFPEIGGIKSSKSSDHLSIDTYGDLGYPHIRIPPVPHYVWLRLSCKYCHNFQHPMYII